MNLNNLLNKEKIAIVAVGYNRVDSLRRLFSSLLLAQYPNKDVPLYISIDASGDEKVYKYVNEFEWPNGDKYVNIQKERLGLRNHIIQCGNLTQYFKAIILLEDDIFVSEYFYNYVIEAVNSYYEDDRIGGISLYRNEMRGNLPIYSIQDGNDSFLKQSVASWGECWTDKQWNGFSEWYRIHQNDDLLSLDMPVYIQKWKKAWSKFYIAYLIQSNKFFIFPSVSHTTCFSEVGENGSYSSTIGQASLLAGPRKYAFKQFEELTQYDIYGTNRDIYIWIGIEEDSLCVDFYGENPNRKHKRFILTPSLLPYKVIKSFGLSLFPIELNIKYNMLGKGIYLYDTSIQTKNKRCAKGLPVSLAYYYLKNFNISLIIRYAISYVYHGIRRKLKF